MAGISDKAVKANYAENKNRNNGKELQNQEFSDGAGLEEYDYGARMLDPQLGVWHNIDPHADRYVRKSPYAYAFDNPLVFVDPNAMDIQKTGNATTYTGLNAKIYFQQFLGGGGGGGAKKKGNLVNTFFNGAAQSYKDAFHSGKEALKPKNWVAAGKGALSMALGTKEGMQNWHTFSQGVSNAGTNTAHWILNAPNMSSNQWAGALGYEFGVGTQIAIGGELGAALNEGRVATEAVAGEEGTGASKGVITITKDGVALPKGAEIPSQFIENPYRSSSYGLMENGKFVEKVRIDPATPANMKGPNISHFHQDGGSEHIFDASRWLWWQ